MRKMVDISLRYVILVFAVVALASLLADFPYTLPIFLVLLTISMILMVLKVNHNFPPRLSLILVPPYFVSILLLYSKSYDLKDSALWGVAFIIIFLICGFAFAVLQLKNGDNSGDTNS
jgi:D-alanyl-lipoteichoic acid acyltransferase DltB (MBOAT superfamily)